MIKVLSTPQIKQLDQFTIEQEPIISIDLMERACRGFVKWFVQHYPNTCRVGIVCGTGNNGGDGLSIARLLAEYHYDIAVWVVRGETKESTDFKINFDRIKDKIKVSEIRNPSDATNFSNCDLLIDALFGSGLTRPVQGIYTQAIQQINQANAVKVSVDIPSGLMADQPSTGEIVKAHRTISFQTPKLSFLLPQNYCYVGEWTLLDIGLSKAFLERAKVKHYLVTLKDVKDILRPRLRFSHKGSFGHGLLVAGSLGKMGACVLSARAALRSGIGLLTIHVPSGGNEIIQMAVPEAMTSIDQHHQHFSTLPDLLNYDSIGIGPGIGRALETANSLKQLLEQYQKPIVLDADALNILSDHPHFISFIAPGSILTPHPKEFERLVGKWENDFERLEKQRELSLKLNSVVLVKGAFTSIAAPNGDIYFNPTGNPGMATGGSGDVLTGILTGLLAQGYNAQEAAILGVYLHGLAGDLAVREVTINALVASDLVNFLPNAFKEVQKER